MCGAIGRVTDSPFVRALMDMLNIQFNLDTDYNIRPNARIPIAIGQNGTATGIEANWWLFQTRTENGYTYDKRYKSFNTRKDKLFTNRKNDFMNNRCVVPASCFYEWKGERFKVEPLDSAIAFGGLYKPWNTGFPDNPHYSCSIITLPPHPRFSHIHDISFSLVMVSQRLWEGVKMKLPSAGSQFACCYSTKNMTSILDSFNIYFLLSDSQNVVYTSTGVIVAWDFH